VILEEALRSFLLQDEQTQTHTNRGKCKAWRKQCRRTTEVTQEAMQKFTGNYHYEKSQRHAKLRQMAWICPTGHSN